MSPEKVTLPDVDRFAAKCRLTDPEKDTAPSGVLAPVISLKTAPAKFKTPAFDTSSIPKSFITDPANDKAPAYVLALKGRIYAMTPENERAPALVA